MNVESELKLVSGLVGDSAIHGMNKPKAKRLVNNLIHPYTRGLFSDQYWRPVDKIFSALSKNNIDWQLEKTYYMNDDKGNSTGKTWKFVVEWVNDKGRPSKAYGVVVAAWAGTVARPDEKYDLVAYVS